MNTTSYWLDEPAERCDRAGEAGRKLVLVHVVHDLDDRDRRPGEQRREERDAVLAVHDHIELATATQDARGRTRPTP